MMKQLHELRNHRALASEGWRRGVPPFSDRFKLTTSLWQWIVFSLFIGAGAALITFIIQCLIKQRDNDTVFLVGKLAVGTMWLFPWLRGLWGLRYTFPHALRDYSEWRIYNFWQRWLAHASLGFILTVGVAALMPSLAHVWRVAIIPTATIVQPSAKQWLSALDPAKLTLAQKKRSADYNTSWLAPLIYFTKTQFLWVWGACTFSMGLLARYLFYSKPLIPWKRRRQRRARIKHTDLPFGLWLGQSTGSLALRYHNASIGNGEHIAVFGDDAAQNILVLGGIGSGKTTGAMQPLLLQLLDQHCGGLIFDIKGDFRNAVASLSLSVNRPYCVIGTQARPLNLLANLTPEMAASFLKSAFLLSGNKLDSFWVDTATELCRNALGVLIFLPQHYSLFGLYQYLFDPEFKKNCHQQIALLPLDETAQRLLAAYRHYDKNVFVHFDDKVKAGVSATVAQVLAPFHHPELIDAFCTARPEEVDLTTLLEGEVVLVDLPLARWGLGAKVIYTLIKLRFFNLMRQRALQAHWNQSRYVFFLCDEYQEIVSASKDGLSDLNFWDKSRSSKTVGIISAQSVSSFYAAIGDRDLTHALLQNFRQKLCFRTEDHSTIELLGRLLGQAKTERISFSKNHGESQNREGRSFSEGESTGYSDHDKSVIDGQFFRELDRHHMLAVLSLNGRGADDVLKVLPVIV